MAEFRMPALGADMEAGTLVEWLKQPGDRVQRGDIIAVVETQKGAIEIEVFRDGVLDKLVAVPGQKLPVGAVMAIIRSAGEAPAVPPIAPAHAPPPQAVKPLRPAAPAGAPPVPAPVATSGHVRASPAARRQAAALGIDLAALPGSAAGGAISLADVERAAAQRPAPALAAAQGMRQAIGAAMARSKREIPHYYLSTTIDLEPALRWLEAENMKRPVTDRLLHSVLLLKATAVELRSYPEFNGYWTEDGFRPVDAVHLGVAVSLRQGGLVAPAIHDADRLALGDLMAMLRDLVRRARAGGLRSSELSDPTITVTNLGEQGVETVFPVIYPPQVAIVGFGAVSARPWIVDGAVTPRRVLVASLAADHRVSDGHRGARFLAAIARLLLEPDRL
ncbi:MAG TPA: dihydrolipoamide acetyltransferase family protein [Candidatus Cybelea sp.]|nr:dihydrolipoamide acetyltransferase family protein [Candidatus Cybelea sp.]